MNQAAKTAYRYVPDVFSGKVAPDAQTKGSWLSKAAEAFADPITSAKLIETAAAFTELRHGQTPEAFEIELPPAGKDRNAKLLIKLETNEERKAWQKHQGALSAARLNLNSRLQSGSLLAFGDPGGPGADPEWIPTRCWMYLDPNPDKKDAVRGDAGAYWYVRVVDPMAEKSSEPDHHSDSEICHSDLFVSCGDSEQLRQCLKGAMSAPLTNNSESTTTTPSELISNCRKLREAIRVTEANPDRDSNAPPFWWELAGIVVRQKAQTEEGILAKVAILKEFQRPGMSPHVRQLVDDIDYLLSNEIKATGRPRNWFYLTPKERTCCRAWERWITRRENDLTWLPLKSLARYYTEKNRGGRSLKIAETEAWSRILDSIEGGDLRKILLVMPGDVRRYLPWQEFPALQGYPIDWENDPNTFSDTQIFIDGHLKHCWVPNDTSVTAWLANCGISIPASVAPRQDHAPGNSQKNTSTVSVTAPGTVSADGWMTLWQLAESIAPRTCQLAGNWLTVTSLPARALIRAELHLIRTDPSVANAVKAIRTRLRPGDNEDRAIGAVWVDPQFLALLHREHEHRVRQRQSMGKWLIGQVIPARLRSILLRGNYDLTAKAPNGQEVSVTERDLVGLNVDLDANALTGDGAIYSAVRVRHRGLQPIKWPTDSTAADNLAPTGAATKATRPCKNSILPAFNLNKAIKILELQKSNGVWPTAPTESETVKFLKLYFNGASNDLLRRARRAVWPDIKPGPRTGSRRRNNAL